MSRKNINDNKLNDGVKILMEYKTKNDFERKKRTSNLKDEKNNNTLRNILIFIILFIVIALIFLFIKYSPLIGVKILDLPKKFKEIINSNTTYYSKYNNNLLAYNSDNLKVYDRNFKIKFEYKLEGNFEPFIVNNDKYMAVADKNNSRIYFFDSFKNITNKKIEGKIEDLYLDEYGNFAIEYSSNNTLSKKVDIINKRGDIKYTLELGNSSISNIKMINNLNKIIILKNYSEGLHIGTKIDIINDDSSIKELITLENKFVFDIKFLSDKLLLLCNDEIVELSLLNNKIKTIYNLTESQISNVKFHDSYFSIIHMDKEKYFYTTFKYDLTEIGNIEIDKIPKIIKSDKYVSYLLYENKMIVINKWGEKIKEFNIFTSPSDLIIFNDGKSVALVYSYKIEILNI